MNLAFELVMAGVSVVMLTILMILIERWFAARPNGGTGMAQAVSLLLVIATLGAFAWLLLETMRFVADELLAFVVAMTIFVALVVMTYLPFRSRVHAPTT
jgi:hypothetical protein